MSASAQTIAGSFPPNSNTTGVKFSEAVLITIFPTLGEPMNVILSTPERTRASPFFFFF